MPYRLVERPVRPEERILTLDVLRGFAMLGVLLAYCLWNLGTAPEETFGSLDLKIDAVATFLVDGKMYTILAFLFGLGFSLQLARASDDSTAVRFYMRRLAALAAIGLGHALLLRNGDILLPYAVTGFLLIPFRGSADRMIVSVAAIAVLAPFLFRYLWVLSGVPLPERPDLPGAPYLVENAAWVGYWLKTAPFTWPNNFALFLLGFVAGRRQLFAGNIMKPSKLATIVIGGALAGTFFYWLTGQMTPIGESELRRMAVGLSFTFHCWGLSIAYVAAITLALGTSRGASAFTSLAAVGRLALTNYLLQPLVIVPLCLTFGWFDHFTPTTALLLALAVFILIQLPFSLIWLRHYQYGPAEWAWRLLTYGRAPPLKAGGDYAPV